MFSPGVAVRKNGYFFIEDFSPLKLFQEAPDLVLGFFQG
jgi:hypothetical protein